MKVHWHLGYSNKTACGMLSYPEKYSKTEFSTPNGDRIECAINSKSVTCLKCCKVMMIENNDIEIVTSLPQGYHGLYGIIRKTERGVLARYQDDELWLPKKSVKKLMNGSYFAQHWAIEKSKKHKYQQQTRK